MQTYKQNDAESAAAEAGEFLNQFLLENKDKPILLMLSAGSSFKLLDYIGKHVLGEHLTISLLDDRFSQESDVNNFAALQKTDFYTDALNSDVNFIGTLPRQNETMESLAQRWNESLELWITNNPKGKIITTFGMGADGHTAGIFPERDAKKFDALFKNNSLVTAYDATGKNQHPLRITTNFNFFKKINSAYVYVCGTDKKPKLDEVLNKQGTINNLPALLWHELKEVKIFTDIQ